MKITGQVRRNNKKEILLKYFNNIPKFMSENLAYNSKAKNNYENQFDDKIYK